MQELQLSNKVAVVTGGGRGIGREVSIAYAEKGACVAVVARSRNEIEETVRTIELNSGTAKAFQADIGDKNEVDTLFESIRSEFGKVDILVNNASPMGPVGRIMDVDPEEWIPMLNVGLVGMVRCTREVSSNMMKNKNGKIINVGSIVGTQVLTLPLSPYSAMKSAVIHWTRCLAEELRPYKINVNSVHVLADTKMTDYTLQSTARILGKQIPESVFSKPLETRILPEENMGLFLFLASSYSDHITGQFIDANSMAYSTAFTGHGED